MAALEVNNALQTIYYEGAVIIIEAVSEALPPDLREIYLEQALAACVAVTIAKCPDRGAAILRRVGLDVMLARPRVSLWKKAGRTVRRWSRIWDALGLLIQINIAGTAIVILLGLGAEIWRSFAH